MGSNSLNKILSTNDIYLAYAASIAKHFKNRKVIFAARKKRITGKSQNNYLSLTHYALKIISVFRKQVLINSGMLIFIGLMKDVYFQILKKVILKQLMIIYSIRLT